MEQFVELLEVRAREAEVHLMTREDLIMFRCHTGVVVVVDQMQQQMELLADKLAAVGVAAGGGGQGGAGAGGHGAGGAAAATRSRKMEAPHPRTQR